MKRIKSIDGLRAVSITMVLLAHGIYTMPGFLTDNVVFAYLSNGGLGVRFFFVISGFLITKLLLTEQQETGRINSKQFYIRRTLRIFPVFYLYILVIILIKIVAIPDIFSHYHLVFFAGSYLWNYQHFFNFPSFQLDKGYWFFGHFWSLAMEEQFYLLWPLAFKSLDRKNLIKLCIGLIILMPFIRAAYYILYPGMHLQLGMMLQTGGDTILTGCLGALLEDKILADKRISFLLKNKVIVCLSFVMLFIVSPKLTVMFKGSYGMTIGMSINNILILFIVLWSIHIPSLVARLLTSKPVVHVGKLSYSLYIWQQLFLIHPFNYWIFQFPQNFVVVFLVATISYYLIEKPILLLKDRVRDSYFIFRRFDRNLGEEIRT